MEILLKQQGIEVANIQTALEKMGYSLPKFGVDGKMGLEVLTAVEEFAEDHQLKAEVREDRITAKLVAAIQEVSKAVVAAPLSSSEVDYHDISNDHPRLAQKGIRPWKQITGITLHQTAIMMSNTLKRFQPLKAHIGILSLSRPTIVQVYPLTSYLWHGHSFNATDVGIEFNGCFEGVDGQRNTAWAGGYKGNPDRLSEPQIIAGREAIRRICSEVAVHGGQVTHIHAHRQSSGTRRGDPGSRAWQEVGLWAQAELRLKDGGGAFFTGTGRPIPKEWDPRYSTPY